MLWVMDIRAALDELGLGPTPTWSQIRAAHRTAIRRAHPDAGGSTMRAARVNEAFDALAATTDQGTKPLRPPRTSEAPNPPATPRASPRTVRAPDGPSELLLQLAEVGHDVGHVVFIDPLAGLLEIVIGAEPGVGQLTVEVGETGEAGVSVAFTLEPLGLATPPPIGEVVDDLLRRHRAAV